MSRPCLGTLLVLTVLLLSSPSLAAAPRFSARLEAGFGVSEASPLSESVLGVTAWAGVGVPARPRRITLDCAVSGAEGDESGDRALSTVLIGVEAINRLTGRGFFAAAGLGIGRATLSGAHSGPMGPDPFRSIPNRDETGFAFGLGLGARSYSLGDDVHAGPRLLALVSPYAVLAHHESPVACSRSVCNT